MTNQRKLPPLQGGWAAGYALMLVAGAALLAPLLAAACATSNDETPDSPDAATILPSSDAATDGALVDAPDGALPQCAVGTLCTAPTPLTLGAIAALNGRSKNDVWASGTGGLLLHFNGREWMSEKTELLDTFSSLFLTADEVWGIAGTLVVRRGAAAGSLRTMRVDDSSRGFSGLAVLPTGEAYVSYSPAFTLEAEPMVLGKITDFDSRTIEFEPDPVLEGTDQVQELAARALFLVPGKALWLVGAYGAVARYPVSPLGSGVVLPVESQATLHAAWGYDDHLWAAGTDGVVLHYNGSGWSKEATGTKTTLRAIFGISPTDIWAAGDEGVVVHYNGTTWSRVPIGDYSGSLRAIWGASSDDVWVGGESGMFHWGPLP